ncbi:MAG: hypothetical protein HC769_25500 [Cyanobacteria bacterium CRU_2_1]|nr:hypothetical protein [Cyanobacteria bacterium CRU_2_1]
MGVLEMVRFTISLPDWYYRKLLLWAKLKGTNRATLSANIIQARIEVNWADIERELETIAKYEGKTLEELQQEWLAEKDE